MLRHACTSPSAEIVAARPCRRRAATRRCMPPRSPTPTPSGASTATPRLDQAVQPVKNTTFAYPDVSIKWFEDGKLNVSANCIDRHLASRGEQTAIIWEATTRRSRATSPTASSTPRSRSSPTCCSTLGREEGRPGRHLPADDPRGRLRHARLRPDRRRALGGLRRLLAGRAARTASSTAAPRLVITADEAPRGGRRTPLKTNVDQAIAGTARRRRNAWWCSRTGGDVPWDAGRDVWLHEEMADASTAHCEPVAVGAEDPLFILYTSGSTGKPKGVLHTTGGYLVYAAMTHAVRLRLPRRRRLLLHRRRRLGHRAQLHRLRPAGQRRHHADVRGRPDLPRRRPLLGGRARSTGSTSSTPRRPRSGR